MAITCTFNPEANLITAGGPAPLSMEDRILMLHGLLDDPALPDGAPFLIDLGTGPEGLCESDLGRLAFFLNRLRIRFSGRIALVNGPAGSATCGFLLAFACEKSDPHIKAFLTRQEAIAWLTADAAWQRVPAGPPVPPAGTERQPALHQA